MPPTRRTPRQERARLTVDALVEASAQVLAERGPDGVTVRAIATRAGVAVGSVYQYFPSKEALLAAVARRHVQRMAVVVGEAVTATVGAPVSERLRALLRAVVDAHLMEPDLHRALVEVAPRLGPIEGHAETLSTLESLVEALLITHRAEIPAGDPAAMAAVLVPTVDATVHRMLFRPHPAQADAIEAELTRMVSGWLRTAQVGPRAD